MDELVAQGVKEHQPLRCEGRGSQPAGARAWCPASRLPPVDDVAALFALLGF